MALGCNMTITSGNDKFFYGWSDAVAKRTQTFNFMPIFARNLSIIGGFLNFRILIFASKVKSYPEYPLLGPCDFYCSVESQDLEHASCIRSGMTNRYCEISKDFPAWMEGYFVYSILVDG